ncbi:MAG: T9SS type A sorting domain-containing protein [Ignavibacteriae bacterium]|nr:T9SS type A sorting domain-containing protein [Ignavibacteriota bacterium]
MYRSVLLAALVVASLSQWALGGEKTRATIMRETNVNSTNSSIVRPSGDVQMDNPTVGVSTTLSGFYDYQSNGGACEHVRVNPANGNIHVTYMLSDDSTAAGNNAARRTAYAFSTNGGTTWNNFSQVRVPARRSGFPTLDLLQGANAGFPTIANHSTITGTQSTIFVDSPEGTGAFSEISAPPLISAGATEPIWPYVAGASDGSVTLAASPNITSGQMNHVTRTADFSTWAAWTQLGGTQDAGGRYPTYANANGRVGIMWNAVDQGVHWYESTNSGTTWPTTPTTIYPPIREVGGESLAVWVGCDFTYDGNTPLYAFGSSTTDGAGGYFFADARIEFWSQATGFVTAVPHDTTLFVGDMNGFNQTNHLTLGYPVIAKSGSRIAIVFQAFQRDTATAGRSTGFRYGDIWFTQSGNNGATWTKAQNISQTANMDERYPSISKYNEAGKINITWQEDASPGSSAFTDLTDTTRSRLIFLKFTLPPITGVDDVDVPANSFKLSQNYPNPFNPATTIDYSVAQAGPVTINVYNSLGQRVATLLDEHLSVGQYQLTFDGARLASGVYIYKMTAGSYSESKKMVLMK